MTSEVVGARAPERMHALDAVRGFALLLGVVFHASFSFVPAPVQLWVVKDSHQSVALGVLFFSIHVFRMTTFFLIAGFFAHMSFHRRGAKSFILDRLKRIALPLVAFWPIAFVSVIAVSIWAAIAASGGHLPKTPPPPWPTFPAFPLTHLWFLYVLLEFYAGALIVRGLMALVDRGGHVRDAIDKALAWLMASPAAPVALAAPLAIAFALNTKWLMWFGIPTPDGSLVTNPTALTGFGVAFGFGWLLHRQGEMIRRIERHWVVNGVLAVGFIAASLAIAGVTPRIAVLKPEAMHLAGAAVYALATWFSTFAVIGLALRFWSGFSPTRRYIADASYWIYIVHLPIVMALQVVVARLDWAWPLKIGFILAIGFPLMFGSYQLLVRHSFIGWVLNGARPPRKPKARLQTRPASSTPLGDIQEASR